MKVSCNKFPTLSLTLAVNFNRLISTHQFLVSLLLPFLQFSPPVWCLGSVRVNVLNVSKTFHLSICCFHQLSPINSLPYLASLEFLCFVFDLMKYNLFFYIFTFPEPQFNFLTIFIHHVTVPYSSVEYPYITFDNCLLLQGIWIQVLYSCAFSFC